MDSGRRNKVHSETDSARAGSTPHIVRWILLISLVAVIVLLSIVWMTGAATQSDAEQNVEVSSEIQELEEDAASNDTDSIVGENADEFETAEPGSNEAPGVPTVNN